MQKSCPNRSADSHSLLGLVLFPFCDINRIYIFQKCSVFQKPFYFCCDPRLKNKQKANSVLAPTPVFVNSTKISTNSECYLPTRCVGLPPHTELPRPLLSDNSMRDLNPGPRPSIRIINRPLHQKDDPIFFKNTRSEPRPTTKLS